MNTLQVDLKVCEGCGALWLRTMPGRVYCRRCAPLLADFPAARGLRRTSRIATGQPVLLSRPAQTDGGAR
jgi:hypothetical protein